MFCATCRSVTLIAIAAAAWLSALLDLGPAVGRAQEIRINELLSSNGATPADENGDFPDWFELFNPTPDAVSLDGWGVSDDAKRPFKWVLRDAVIESGEHLLLFASGKDRQPARVDSLGPETIPGLRLWLRADAVSANSSTQVRRDGTTVYVRQWRDQSGSGNHAVQTTDASQPTWLATGPTGTPALRFDGVDDQLRLPRPLATNSFSLLAVFSTARPHETDPEGKTGVGGVAGQRYLFGAQHGGDSNAGTGLSVGTNGVAVYEHGSGYMPALAVFSGPLGPGNVLVGVHYDAKQLSLDVQGLAARAGMASPRVLVTAPVEIGLGAYGAFDGALAEVLLYDRPLAENERLGLARYLADKYGIAVAQPRHTNFQLSSQGEELQLTRPDASVADSVRFGPIARDISYGRQPDGSNAFVFFREPTPGAPNSTPGATELLDAPVFSHPGGFHANGFDLRLSITNADARIHYTLDGSDPDETSPRHTEPLRIASRIGTPNDISMIPTVPGGPPPAGEVFKGWVVRARAFKPGTLPSPTVTRTFWVDPRERARYSLPVVSLTTDRANLFDRATGIYVAGDAPNGNYSQRGPEWERPAHVELYETDNQPAFAQEIDVKIHGNTSQGFPIKGLDLDATGGRGRQPFRYRLFPDRARGEFEHVLLRPTGHDQPTAFMRDELMQSLAAETDAESQAARACVLFINGEYWGLHYLKEKEDAEFVAHYADRAEDAIDYLEGYAAPKAGDTMHYQAMIDFIATHDLADPAHYARVATLMEVPNYIDYKACEIFFYRWDIGNHRLWRPRTPDGRWRWLQFDNDVGWGGFWAEQPAWLFNMLAADLTPDASLHGHNNEVTTFLLRHLVRNAQFRRDFVNRFQDLLNTLFLPSHTQGRIDQMASVLAPEMAEHTRRWRSPASLADWQNNVRYLRMYAVNRPANMREHLRQYFRLDPSCTFTAGVRPPQAGALRLNTLEIREPADQPWSGLYFQRHPVTVRAEPRPGFRFDRWDGLPGVSTNEVTLLLNGDFALAARFAPDPAAQPRFTRIRRSGATSVELTVTGPPRGRFQLESSDDLSAWSTRQSLELDDAGSAVIPEPVTTAPRHQFYRLRGSDGPSGWRRSSVAR